MMNRRFLGRCYEACFQYFEAVCFKTWPYEYQILLMKTAFFSCITPEILTSILGYQEKEAYYVIDELVNSYGALRFQGEEEYRPDDFLTKFLQKRQAAYLGTGELKNLYEKAFEYYQKKEDWQEALRFADLNGNVEEMVLCLHEICTLKTVSAQFAKLEVYMRSVPENYIVEDARLLSAYAMLEAVCGNKNGSLRYVHLLKRLLAVLDQSTNGYRDALAAYTYLQLALPFMPPEQLWKQLSYVAENEKDSFQDYQVTLSSATPSLLHGGRDFLCYINSGKDWIAQIQAKAKFILKEEYDSSEKLFLGEVAYEQGKLNEALGILSKALGVANNTGCRENYYVSTVLLSKIMFIRNQSAQAAELLKKLERYLNDKEEYQKKNLEAYRAYCSMMSGDRESAKRWGIYRFNDDGEDFFTLNRYYYMIRIYFYIMKEEYESALMVLHRLLEYAKDYNRKYDELHMRLLEICIDFRLQNSGWEDRLEELMNETEQLGLVRIFADRGALLYPVFLYFKEKRKESAFGSSYRKAVLNDTKSMALLYPDFLSVSKMSADQLSSYEMDVLQCLNQGMKNAEIAQKLFLSENTVKYHLKKIYQKLEATSRSEAVAKARKQGLI